MLLTSWVRSFRQSLKADRRSGFGRRSQKRAAWLTSKTPAKHAELLEHRELLTALVIDQNYVDARNGVVNVTNVNLDIDGDGIIESSSGEFDSIVVNLDPRDPIGGANTGITINLSGLDLDRIAFKEATLRDPSSTGINVTLNNVDLNSLTFETVEIQSGIGGGIGVNLTDVELGKLTVYDSRVIYDASAATGIPARLSINATSQTRNTNIDELDISDSTLDGVSITSTGRQLQVVGGLGTVPIELITADHGLQNNTLVDITGVSGLSTANTRTTISPVVVPNTITNLLEFDENSISLDTTSPNADLTADINATETVLSVSSVSLFYPEQLIEIGDELMQVTAVGTSTITVSRGAMNTVATSHLEGDVVRALPVSVSLQTSINSTTDTLAVSDGRVFQTGQLLLIDTEQFLVTTVSGDTLTVSREQNGTAAAQHGNGSRVRIITPISALASAINDEQTTLAVDDGSMFRISQIIQIDNEAMLITAIEGNSLTVQREIQGTTAAAHLADAVVTTLKTSGAYSGSGRITVPTTIGSIRITDSSILGQSGDDGLTLTLTTTRVGSVEIEDNQTVSSIDLNLTDSPTDGLRLSGNTNITATRPQINAVQFDLTRSTLTNVEINSNTVTGGNNTGGGGIVFNATDSNVYGTFRGNTVQQTVGNGLEFRATATPSFLTTNRGPLVFDFASQTSETTLAEEITAEETEISVVDGRFFQEQQLIQIADETIFVVRVTGNTLHVLRGQRGTLALPQAFGERVRSVTSSIGGDRSIINNNVFQNNLGAGIFADLPVGTSLKAQIESNQFRVNALAGIHVEVQDTAAAKTILDRGGIARVFGASTLTSTLNSTATTLSVVDPREYFKQQLIQLNGELLRILEIDGSVLTVERGLNDTVPATHNAGTLLDPVTVPLRVADADVFAGLDLPFNVAIESEELTVESRDLANDVLLVRRGINGTIPAFHSTNTVVTAERGDALQLDIGGSTVASGNRFDTNSTNGISVLMQDKSAGTVNVRNNVIIGTQTASNSGNGINIQLLGTNVNQQATNILRRSEIASNFIGAAGAGKLVSAITAVTTVFTVTDATAISTGSKVQIDGELVTVTNVAGNTLTVTRAGNAAAHTAGTFAVPNANGNAQRGINIFFDERSALEDLSITSNVIANNNDDGIRIRREDDGETRTVNPAAGQARAITIADNAIIGNGLEAGTEQLAANGAFVRYAAGVEIVAANGSEDIFDLELRNNRIIANVQRAFQQQLSTDKTTTQATNGVSLRAEADAQIIADLTGNQITFNEGDAVELTTRENGNLTGNSHGVVATDRRDIGGSWTGNTFSDNYRHGIEIEGRFGSVNLLEIGREGVGAAGTLGNSISRNGLNGVDIRRGGNATITNNTISNNGPAVGNTLYTQIGSATQTMSFVVPGTGTVLGSGGILGSGIFVANGNWDTVNPTGQDANRTVQLAIKQNTLNSNTGIAVSLNGYTRDNILATIRDNQITSNLNDGIELRGHVEVAVLGNFISQNVGRGIDVLSHGQLSGQTFNFTSISGSHSDLVQSNYRIGDGTEAGRNRIISNLQEGIYYVSSGGIQDMNLLSTNLASRSPSGPVTTWPAAILKIDTNTVSSNGVSSGLSGTGIVFWVGSTGGAIANGPNFDPAYVNGDGWSTGPGTIGGRIDGTPVSSNRTVARTSPLRTTTEINSRTNAQVVNNVFEGNFGDDFRVESFISTVDPLPTTATNWDQPGVVPPYRLDVYVSDPLARLNLEMAGNRGNGLNVRNYTTGYTNSEPLFKSRTGPFVSATRPRDVTRTPSRISNYFPLPPLAGGNPTLDAVFGIVSVDPINIGNGITQLMVTLTPDINGIYANEIPSGVTEGATVEIHDVVGVNGQPHSANGVFQVVEIDYTARTLVLTNTAGEGGPAYDDTGIGGTLSFNLRTAAGMSDAPPFQYPGIGGNTLRIAQGFDTSGSSSTNAFRTGDNFSGDSLLGPDQFAPIFTVRPDPQDWYIWTPLRAKEGVITDVSSIAPAANRLTVTSANHGLTDRRIIEITGISGFPAANGMFQVEVVDNDQFIINLIPRNTSRYIYPQLEVDGAYIGGGAWRTVDESFPDPSEPTFPVGDVGNVTPDPRFGTPGVVTLNFTEPVKSLDVDDLFLTRDGIPLDVSGVTITEINAKQYVVDLSAITTEDGAYRLIVDTAFPTAEFVPVTPDPASGPIGTVTLNFSEDITGLDISDLVLELDRGGPEGYVAINLTETGPNTILGNTTTLQGANLNVRQITPSQYTVDLSTVSDAVGDYRLTLAAPRTVTITGIEDPTGGTVTIGEQIRIFAQDHGLATGQFVTLSSVLGAIQGPNTNLNGRYRVEVLDNDRFRLATDTQVNQFVVADDFFYRGGSFTYTPDIVDRVGRPFSFDPSSIVSDATATWTRVNTAPTANIIDVDPDPRSAPVDRVRIVFSERVNFGAPSARQITSSDFRLSRDVGQGATTVSLASATVFPLDLDSNNFVSQIELRNLAALTSIAGRYRLTIINNDATRIGDVQGTTLAANAIDDFQVITNGPHPTLVPVTPSRTSTPILDVTLQFDVPVDGPVPGITTLDASRHLVLTRDVGDGRGKVVVPLLDPTGNPLLLRPTSDTSPTDFELDITNLTSFLQGTDLLSVDGAYELTLLPGLGIKSRSAPFHPLGVGSKINWIQDSIRPVADIVDISPNPRATSAGSVTIRFNEPVSGLSRNDASVDFILTYDARDNAGPQDVSLSGVRVRPINPTDEFGNPISDPFFAGTVFASEYVIDFDLIGFTDLPGIYRLRMTDAGQIEDLTHNAYEFTLDADESWQRVVKLDNDRITDLTYSTSPIFRQQDVLVASLKNLSTLQEDNPVAADAIEDWFQDSQIPFVVPGSVAITPDPRSTSVGIVTIQFSENVTGVTISDFVLTRTPFPAPGSTTTPPLQNVSLANVPLVQISPSTYTIDLNLVTGAAGDYVFSIQGTGSLIFDNAGNPLAEGAAPLDSWQVQSVGPAANLTVTTPRTTAANNVQLAFTKPVDLSAVNLSDFRLERDSGSGFVLLGTANGRLAAGQGTITPQSVTTNPDTGRQYAKDFVINLSAGTLTSIAGTYRLTLVAADSDIVDEAEVELGADAQAIWVLDNVRPTGDIVDISPDPLPAGTSAGIINVVFSEAVTGVDIADFQLLRGSTVIPLTGVVVAMESPRRFTLDLTTQTLTDGDYQLRLLSNDSATPIRDLAGNQIIADSTIGISNVAARDQWFQGVDTVRPTVTFSTIQTPRNTAVPTVLVTFSEDVNPATVGVSDFRLTRNSVSVPLTNATITRAPGSDSRYLLNLEAVTSEVGTYVLSLVSPDTESPIVDKVGNQLATGTAATATWVNQQIDPFPTLSPVSPSSRYRDAGIVTLSFTTPVQGVDISDFRLTRASGSTLSPVSLRGITVEQSANGATEYFIDLSAVTGTGGDYRFQLVASGSGITEPAGSPLLSNATIEWSTSNQIDVNRTFDRVDPNPGDGIVGETISGQPVRTLRAAIMEAGRLAGDDTIVLGEETYSLSDDIIGEDFAARGDLDIFDTTGVTKIVGQGADKTIIDGGDLDRIFHVTKGATLILEGVTLRNGKVVGSDDGGAIRNDSGLVQISNVVITSNVSDDDGGAINNDGEMIIINSTLTANSARNNGGAIRNIGNLRIENSLIGGSLDTTATPAVDTRNVSGLSGGAIVNIGGGTVSILNSTISGNRTTGVTSVGGAIANLAPVGNLTTTLNSPMSTTDTTLLITDADAFPQQLLYDIQIGAEVMRVVAVSGNRLTVERGINGVTAAHAVNAAVTLLTNFNLLNTTITLNASAARGGGLFATTGKMLVQNTIIAGNTAVSQGPDAFGTNTNIVQVTGLAGAGTNIVGNNTDSATAFAASKLVGTKLAPVDPLLGPLTDNGGPTLTHALLRTPVAQSIAIDAGLSTSRPRLTDADATDQRGITRILANVDIGAYEFGGFFVTSEVDSADAIPGDGVVADNFGRATLRAAIMEANALPGPNAIKLDGITYALGVTELDRIAPTVTFQQISGPLQDQMSGLNPIDTLDFSFSEPVNVPLATSLLPNIQIVYTSPMNVTTITSLNTTTAMIAADPLDRTRFTLSNLRTLFAADGLYEIRFLTFDSLPVAPLVVADFEGNRLAADPATGFASYQQFVRGVDSFAPTANLVPVTPATRTSSPLQVTINFSEVIAGIVSDNFTLDFNDGVNPVVTIPLTSASIQQPTATQYILDLSSVAGLDQTGRYTLSFDSSANAQVLDLAGQAFASGPLMTFWDLVPDTFVPVASWTPVTPSPRIGQVGVVTLSFDEDVEGIELNDAEVHFDLTIDVDGTTASGVQPAAPLDLSGVSVIQVDPRTYTIDLTDLTIQDGFYTLTFNPTATDAPSVTDTATPVNTMTAAGIVSTQFIIGDDLAKFGAAGVFNVNPEDAANFGDLDIVDASGGSLTIIGEGNSTSINAANIDRVFDLYAGQVLRLESLQVTGGQLLQARDGAGIRNDGGTLTLDSVELAVNNAEEGRGGGVFNNGTLAMVASRVESNVANFGGGVFNDQQGVVTLDQGEFTGNQARANSVGANGDGGAIYNDRSGKVTIAGTEIRANSAGRHGGAIYNNDLGEVTLRDSTVTSNTAERDGGAIFNELSQIVTITNSTLALNIAERGGAVFDQDGHVEISESAFTGNTAKVDGGALFTTSSATADLGNSTISGNIAGRDGGGFFNEGTLDFSNSLLIDNQAGGSGGAIRSAREVTLTNTRLITNTAKSHGGALLNASGGIVTIVGSNFERNVSDSDNDKIGDGGAISNRDTGSISMVGTGITGNRAGSPTVTGRGTTGGGIQHSSTGTFTISNSTIAENSAETGGGISTTKAVSISNSTVSTNFARTSGGGFFNNGGTISVVNSTVYDNTATTSGGGIRNESVLGAFGLKNTIVAGNTASTGQDISGSGFSNQGNNLIGTRGTITTFQDGVSGNLVGTDSSRVDPLLGPLQANGGGTRTHALLFGSPARDRGSNVGVASTDQRGFARVFDGDGNGVATVDIGSFESGFVVNTFLDTRDVKPGDLSSADEDGSSSLRAAIMEANQLDGDDTILLIPGTFRLTIAGRGEEASASGDLDIVNDSITIIGAGTDQTFIDAADLDRVFDVKPGATLNLKNLTLLGGDAVQGGGVLNRGTLTTENVIIRDNRADYGAGIFSTQVQTTLSANITAAQTAITVPAASVLPAQVPFVVQVDNELVTVTNVAAGAVTTTLTVTRAVVPVAHNAGAPVVIVGSTTVFNTTLTGNRARLQGGGLFSQAATTVSQSTISNNRANAQGGGVINQGTLSIVDTTISSNTSFGTGGGLYNDGVNGSRTAVVTLDRTTIAANRAGTRGGGIHNTDEIRATNITVSGNHAGGSGGGIYNRLHETSTAIGTMSISNATIVENTTDGDGGGVTNADGTTVPLRTPTVTVKNTIIAINSARNSDADVRGAFISQGNNFIGSIGSASGLENLLNNDQVGTAASPIDPDIAPLASNGGFTQTHALLEGSLAVGKGDNSGGEPRDQRLGIRPVDDTADIGAFESQDNKLRIESQSGILERDEKQTLVSFVVLLSQAAAETITVQFATEQDTAQELSDFLPTSGTLTFAPGELAKAIVVEVNGDITAEDVEKFKVRLSNPINATFESPADAVAEGTILNDDAYVSISDVAIVEGDSGTQIARFTVTLDKPVIDQVTVNYATSDVTALTSDGDYVATSGTLLFEVDPDTGLGETSKTIEVVINGDTTLEAYEIFMVTLSGAIDDAGFSLPFRDAVGVGTIQNDEVSISIQDTVTVLEGDAGVTTPANFTISLAQPVGVAVSIQATAVGGTAVGGSDFTPVSQVVTFAPGETSRTFAVNVIGDNRYEDPNRLTPVVAEDETFTVTLSNPTRGGEAFPSAVVDSVAAIGAIQNDDPAPAQWIIRQIVGGGMIEVLKDGVVQSTNGLVTALVVDGTNQDDVFTVEFENGNPIPTAGLTINGGLEDGGDVLVIQDDNNVFTATNIVYTSTGAESGTVAIDASVITYSELEPISDLLGATNRVINLHDGVNHDALLVDDTAVASNSLLVSRVLPATFESISFAAPTGSLTVNLGNGANELAIGVLDPLLVAPVVINAGGGADTIDASLATKAFEINGGDGNDIILGGSAADTINGGAGADDILGGGDDDTLRGHEAATADDNANDTIDGEGGNDSINGEGGIDSLVGGSGDDELLGGEGNDVLEGGAGADRLEGELGNDQLIGNEDDDTLLGGAGNDQLQGGSGADSLEGGDDNDVLSGGLDDDDLLGGAGDDVLNGDEQNDQLLGGTGNDTLQTSGGIDVLDGEDGIDRFDAIASGDNDIVLENTRVTVGTVVTTFERIEVFQLTGSDDANRIDASLYSVGSVTINGNGGNDTLIGGVGDDVINGGNGVDIIYAQTGNDTISGGNERDSIYGEAGNDSILGDAGDDFIEGGNNNDIIYGGTGRDSILGGSGNDVMYGDSDNDTLMGETGNDHLVGNDGEDLQDGGIGDDVLYGGSGADTLMSGIGNDLADGQGNVPGVEVGQNGTDLLVIADGTAADDIYTITFSAPHFLIARTNQTPFSIRMKRTENVQINLGAGNDRIAASDLSAAVGESVRFEVDGGAGNDTIDGSASNKPEIGFAVQGGVGSDSIVGGRGFDTLRGGDDGDYILGAIGKDMVYGDAGDDTLNGGGGNDSVFGGIGNDIVRGGSGADTLQGETGNDTLLGDSENDALYGGDGDDKGSGGTGNDYLDGGNGVDALKGDDGNDVILGGNGDDVLSGGAGNDGIRGGFGRDYVFGNSGIDTLQGSNDPDVIIGGDGNDSIDGNGGFDTLTGGNGGGDAPDADLIAETTEIDNAFVVAASILNLLNF